MHHSGRRTYEIDGQKLGADDDVHGGRNEHVVFAARPIVGRGRIMLAVERFARCDSCERLWLGIRVGDKGIPRPV